MFHFRERCAPRERYARGQIGWHGYVGEWSRTPTNRRELRTGWKFATEGREEGDVELGLMGAFREIGYGALFFIVAMVGAGVGAIVWRGDGYARQTQAIQWVVEGAVGGAVAGSALWLWAKRRPGRYGYAAMLTLCALAGASIGIFFGKEP